MENKELLFTFVENGTLTTYFFLCIQVRDTQNVRFSAFTRYHQSYTRRPDNSFYRLKEVFRFQASSGYSGIPGKD
jgi:hypothetical protein